MFFHKRLEVGNDRGGTPERKLRVEPILERRGAELLELPHVAARPRDIVQLRERPATPERQGVLELACGDLDLPGGDAVPPLTNELCEPQDVDGLGRRVQAV